ncbi:histidine kinase [Streptomyces coelicoflavus]|uniref:sensor histidine kinase n=1 Tax=Streptomyces TaxID=1883 RepID=UPI0012919273|nr:MULTISPECIES: histidine kinase [Streptomyces]MCX5036439.1 histidine kinase [Streptomyces coelicoflavus]QFX82648.1 two-component sensor histidine kinase [Streptomyces sp. SYP-A7193]
MTRAFRPFLRGSTYSGALLALLGAMASAPLLPLAVLPALAWRSAPYGVRAGLVLLIWAALITAVGFVPVTRRVLTASARRLLKVRLPNPASPTRSDRLRTPAWLLLHVAFGWTGTLAGGVLLLTGLALPQPGTGGDREIVLFDRTLRPEPGWQSWVGAVACVLLALLVCVAVSGALRWLAPRLLGPSAAERLALAAERERRLAERNRLAHELHDSIGHTLTAATIQAAVAGEVLAADPVAARSALRSIEESTRAALEDLDHVLGVLRDERAETAPVRTLAELPELLGRLRHTGAVIETDLTGDLAQVPGTLSRAAYRILQEGLTNALRHGDGGPIRVEVDVAAAQDGLRLGVVNRTGRRTGTGPDADRGVFPTSGHGLRGLAERVRLLHGEFDAGPDGTEHWRLAVRLPVRLSA